MTTKVKPIPDGYHTLTPYLITKGAAKAIEFYKKAFGATELMRMPGPEGKVMHAELQVGDSRFMMADECPEMQARSPLELGGSPVSLLLYVEDVDSFFNRAISAGAKEVKPLKDQFYGDRCGSLSDPFGHIWHVATHKEDVPPAELQKRAATMCQGQK
jgi:PhnB protein